MRSNRATSYHYAPMCGGDNGIHLNKIQRNVQQLPPPRSLFPSLSFRQSPAHHHADIDSLGVIYISTIIIIIIAGILPHLQMLD